MTPKEFYFKYRGMINDVPTLVKELGMPNSTNPVYERQGDIIEHVRPDVYDVSTFENEGTLEVLKIDDLVLVQKNINWHKFANIPAINVDFPLHVTKRKDGKLVLEDGYTRLFLKVLFKQDTVMAYVLDVGTYERKNYLIIPKEHEELEKIKIAAKQMMNITTLEECNVFRIPILPEVEPYVVTDKVLPIPPKFSYVEFERITQLENGWRFKTIG